MIEIVWTNDQFANQNVKSFMNLVHGVTFVQYWSRELLYMAAR